MKTMTKTDMSEVKGGHCYKCRLCGRYIYGGTWNVGCHGIGYHWRAANKGTYKVTKIW